MNFVSRARVLIGRRAAVRDIAEASLVSQCRERGVPVLGICRGAQVMAVAVGGSLHPSVQRAFCGARYPHHPLGYMTFRKQITIEEASTLHRTLGTTELAVNSLHRQAVASLPDDLPVTAREANGVVQAFEDPAHPFFMGVQFHPELLVHRIVYRRLFRALVRAARSSSGASFA
jgi:putative glutamine amidotransferase